MKKNLRKSQFDYQAMEPRQLLAGDVTVVQTDNLYIRGDASPNQIQIVATESGEVLIKGLNNTTINGGTDAFKVAGATNLNGARGRNASIDVGLRIKTYAGNDRIDIQGLEVEGASWILTGDGDDMVRFQKSTSRHNLNVDTQNGDDVLRLVQARAMGDLKAMTGNGQDEIKVWNSRVWQDAMFLSGDHDDQVTVGRVRFTGDNQQVLTQGGEDRVEFMKNNVNAAGVNIDAGRDNDRVIAEMTMSNEILGMVEFNGRSGMDVLTMDGQNQNSNRFTSEGFENNGGEIVFAHNEEITSSIEVFDRGEQSKRFGAERVQFAEATMISSVEWRGTYNDNSVATQDIFVIEIYEDELINDPYEGEYRAPTGDPIASFTVGDGIGEDVSRVDTGEILTDPSDFFYRPRTIFSFEAEIDYVMEAGKSYWVSIHSIPSDQVADDAKYFELGSLDYDADITDQSAYFTGGFNNQGEFQSFWLPSARWDIALRS